MPSDSSSQRATDWIKARRSGNSGNCVEMRRHEVAVQVRDSKQSDGDVLAFPPCQFTAWVAAARRGEFTRQS